MLFVLPASNGRADPKDYFAIIVVDEETGRGVPLVELRTVHDVKYYTDSNRNDDRHVNFRITYFNAP